MKKTVFQTDLDGLYLYDTVANELAMEPGAFNIPFGAQEVPPPAAPAGQVARWAGSAWVLVEDHRATQFYRTDSGQPYAFGSTIEVEGVAVSYKGWGAVPTWLTDVQPQPPEEPAPEV